MGEKKSRSVRSRILLIVINIASLGSLFWALRGAHLSELKQDLAEMSWWWVALAVVADVRETLDVVLPEQVYELVQGPG